MASIIKVDQIQESTVGVGTNFSNTGSATTPTISIGNQTNKGFYHLANDKIGVSVGGQRVGEIGAGYGGFTGNIIQVQSTTKSDTFSSSSTSYVDITGLSVGITPKYSNSKIHILINIGSCGMSSSHTTLFRITRNDTAIGVSDVSSSRTQGSFKITWTLDANHAISGSIGFLDTPSSTSLLTYKVQIKAQSSGTTYINRSHNDSDGTDSYQGRTISNITVMEIQQ